MFLCMFVRNSTGHGVTHETSLTETAPVTQHKDTLCIFSSYFLHLRKVPHVFPHGVLEKKQTLVILDKLLMRNHQKTHKYWQMCSLVTFYSHLALGGCSTPVKVLYNYIFFAKSKVFFLHIVLFLQKREVISKISQLNVFAH